MKEHPENCRCTHCLELLHIHNEEEQQRQKEIAEQFEALIPVSQSAKNQIIAPRSKQSESL